MAALRILDAAGIIPVDLGLRRPSLDDVFLSLTGRSAGEDDLADLVRNVFVVLLMIVVGMAVGFRFHNGFLPAVAAVFVALLLGYALSWVFALIGLTVADPETAQLAGILPIFPLVFASSVFVSIQSMPGWLQAFAQNQPISRAADTVRALTQGGPVATNLIWTILWSTAILAVFAPLAVRRYRKV
jgi:ABC-2 type transport system permease protein